MSENTQNRKTLFGKVLDPDNTPSENKTTVEGAKPDKNIAFIPVRGGSRSIPLKNIKMMAGMPLVYWTVKAACDCSYIDKVYVATDSHVIKETVEGFKLDKVCVIGRSEASATDTASTESAMLEFAEQYEFENIVLIQATSPLLTDKDLNGGFVLYGNNETDSVLSVVRQKRFNWKLYRDGTVKPSNYDVNDRPRRQEFDGYLVENGAFYITSRENLIASKNRLSGRIRAYEMPEETYFEIDEPSDFLIAEGLLLNRLRFLKPQAEAERDLSVGYENRGVEGSLSESVLSAKPLNKSLKVPDIKMFLTDCDGCLTDGGMYYSENGDELKKFNTLDGMGLKLLKEKGIITGIVTAEDRRLNKRRAEKLKLDILVNSAMDKLDAIKRLSEKYGIPLENIAYVGDDINDIQAVQAVGYGCSVKNGAEQVKKVAKFVSEKSGGEGAIREIADHILSGMKKTAPPKGSAG